MVKLNYSIEVMTLALFAAACVSSSSKCEDWEDDDFPPFVRKLSQNGTEDYCDLYEREMNMSRCEFYYSLKQWAEKYQVKEQTDKLIRQEMSNERKLNKVLAGRLRNINGTADIKDVLLKVLKMQQEMHLPLIEIEQNVDELMASLPATKRQEATMLWNALCPHDMHGPCPSRL